MIVLWSELFALWFDRTRRRAVPLLLATLLLLIPSLPARWECSCEPGQHHHGMAHCPDGYADDHDEDQAHEHHEHSPSVGAAARFASARTGQAHLLAGNLVASRVASCCSCSRAPLTAAVVAAPAPSAVHAHSQALFFVRAQATPVFRFDSLAGLFGRAGPPPEGKPKLLFLACLAGRAPPVSL